MTRRRIANTDIKFIPFRYNCWEKRINFFFFYIEERYLIVKNLKYISAYRHQLFYKVDCNARSVPTLIHSSKAINLQFPLLSVMLRLKIGLSNSKHLAQIEKGDLFEAISACYSNAYHLLYCLRIHLEDDISQKLESYASKPQICMKYL